MRVIVAGCGWLGTEIARALVLRGDDVTGVRRDPARAEGLAVLGVRPLALDLLSPDAEKRLPSADAIIACQAAVGEGEGPYRAAYLQANAVLLCAAARSAARAFVYTGSTGVFGQKDGSDVDESTLPAPASSTAEVLLDAERLVRGSATGTLKTVVVRLSGLYGPGRIGTVERVKSGALALGEGDRGFMNFCHRADAVTFVLAALDRGAPGAVYHGSDASPPRRREVVEWMSERLGLRAPNREGPTISGPNRRVLSERTRRELGVELRYPSFREGFSELVAREGP